MCQEQPQAQQDFRHDQRAFSPRADRENHLAITQEREVAEAYGRWFIIGAAQRADGWVLMTGVRRDPP